MSTTRHTEVFNTISQCFSIIHVSRGQLRNAFGVGFLELQWGTKSNRSQDSQLMRSINALDIESWICLGITQGLRFLQYVFKGAAFLTHFAENKVTGTVDN